MGCAGSKEPEEVAQAGATEKPINGTEVEAAYASDVKTIAPSLASKFVQEHNGSARLADVFDLNDSIMLGRGMAGCVRTCARKGTKDKYALKSLEIDMLDPQSLHELRIEIDILRGLDHPHIVRLFETFLDRQNGQLHVVMELLPGGNLKERIRMHENGYSEERAAEYIRQMMSSILYCHEHGVCHRDIKLENFVFEESSENSALKLIDFGLAAHVKEGDEEMHDSVGTVPFMAPEVLSSRKPTYTSACDMWSLGVVAFELLAGSQRRPYAGKSKAEQLRLINKGPPTLPAGWSASAADFVTQLLARDPQRRMSARAALDHPWLQQAIANLGAEGTAMRNTASKALEKFAKVDGIKQLAAESIAFSMPPAKLAEMRKVFDAYDKDCSGTLSKLEVMDIFHAQTTYTDEEIRVIFEQIDTSHNGVVDYIEFLGAMVSLQASPPEEAVVHAAFAALDSDGDGAISSAELVAALGDKGFTEEELRQAGGDGKTIDFDHFKVMIMRRRESLASMASSQSISTSSIHPILVEPQS